MGKRIGIMGGTFDPIHLGHMLIAENAFETFNLDEVLFIPSGNSYMKKDVSPSSLRVKMTGISIEDNPHFAMSTIEADRDGNSYTYETLQLLKEKYPDNEYYFIVGADSFVYMDQWKNPDIIFSLANILVASRIGNTIDELKEKALVYKEKYNAKIDFLSIKNVDISSTEIRNLIKEDRSIRYLVHVKLVEYIKKNNIYK